MSFNLKSFGSGKQIPYIISYLTYSVDENEQFGSSIIVYAANSVSEMS